jgi:hypothetical protein
MRIELIFISFIISINVKFTWNINEMLWYEFWVIYENHVFCYKQIINRRYNEFKHLLTKTVTVTNNIKS